MKYIKQSFLFVVLSFLLATGVSIASSWVGPTAEPPNNNVSAPINVSSTSQTKLGALSVGGFALVDSTKGAGKVLTSDADGKASWSNSINKITQTRIVTVTISNSVSTGNSRAVASCNTDEIMTGGGGTCSQNRSVMTENNPTAVSGVSSWNTFCSDLNYTRADASAYAICVK